MPSRVSTRVSAIVPIPELIVLHVIEPSELPPFADSPVLEAEAFEREFMIRVARNVPRGSVARPVRDTGRRHAEPR